MAAPIVRCNNNKIRFYIVYTDRSGSLVLRGETDVKKKDNEEVNAAIIYAKKYKKMFHSHQELEQDLAVWTDGCDKDGFKEIFDLCRLQV